MDHEILRTIYALADVPVTEDDLPALERALEQQAQMSREIRELPLADVDPNVAVDAEWHTP